MPQITLPYGNNSFESDALVRYVASLEGQYIIQGQVACARANHPKPSSLDCWLRDNYAHNPDTKQAVNEVIKQIIATSDFISGNFLCPDSGRVCKGLKLKG